MKSKRFAGREDSIKPVSYHLWSSFSLITDLCVIDSNYLNSSGGHFVFNFDEQRWCFRWHIDVLHSRRRCQMDELFNSVLNIHSKQSEIASIFRIHHSLLQIVQVLDTFIVWSTGVFKRIDVIRQLDEMRWFVSVNIVLMEIPNEFKCHIAHNTLSRPNSSVVSRATEYCNRIPNWRCSKYLTIFLFGLCTRSIQ